METKQKNDSQRPGFLIYYETLDALNEYTEAETGLFIRAMADFARFGVCPEFTDRGLRGLWRVVQPVLSRDDISYNERCRKNRYSSYISAVKRRFQKEHPGKGEAAEGRDYLCYEDWIIQVDEANGSERSQTEANASERKRTLPNGSQYNQKGNITQYNGNINENGNGNRKGEPGETQSRPPPQSAAIRRDSPQSAAIHGESREQRKTELGLEW